MHMWHVGFFIGWFQLANWEAVVVKRLEVAEYYSLLKPALVPNKRYELGISKISKVNLFRKRSNAITAKRF